MSLSQYKRLQQVTEGLLEKLALPEQTLSKYEALKKKILSRPNPEEFESGEDIMLHIKDSCIRVHELFLKTTAKVVDSITDGSWVRTDELIQEFSAIFEEHKKAVRTLTVKGLKDHKETVSGLGLKWERVFEELEHTEGLFDKFTLSLHSLQESLSVRAQAENELADHMKILETELSDANTLSNKVSTLAEQLNTAKVEAAKYREYQDGLNKLVLKYSRFCQMEHSATNTTQTCPLGSVSLILSYLEEQHKLLQSRLMELEVINEEMLRADGRQRKYISNTVSELKSITTAAHGKTDKINRLEEEILAILGVR